MRSSPTSRPRASTSGSRFEIYDALRRKASEGVAVVVKSSDPLELAGLCDRVVVMSRGRIVDEIPAAELERAADRGGDRRLEERTRESPLFPAEEPQA